MPQDSTPNLVVAELRRIADALDRPDLEPTGGRTAADVAASLRGLADGLAAADTLDEAGELGVESGVSLFTGEPFVILRLDDRHVGQVDPAAARKISRDFAEAAEAAESDALMAHQLAHVIGLPGPQVAAFIVAIREGRDTPPAWAPIDLEAGQ